MQEEVNEKTVSLCITGGKVTVRLLKQAMMRFLAAIEKEKAEKPPARCVNAVEIKISGPDLQGTSSWERTVERT